MVSAVNVGLRQGCLMSRCFFIVYGWCGTRGNARVFGKGL